MNVICMTSPSTYILKKIACIYIIHTHTFREHKIMQMKSKTFKTVNKRISKVFTTLALVSCIYSKTLNRYLKKNTFSCNKKCLTYLLLQEKVFLDTCSELGHTIVKVSLCQRKCCIQLKHGSKFYIINIVS